MKKAKLAASVIAVAALAAAAFVGCSDKSDTDDAPEKLSAPVITVTENTVEWAPVENAAGYIVYVNDVAEAPITETEYTVEETEPGVYRIYVIAKAASGGGYADSDKSNTEECEIFSAEDEELTKLMLVNNPVKTDYFLDETAGGGELDLTGLVVNARYSNGSMKKVTATPAPVDLTTEGFKTVELSYTEDGRTVKTTFVVNVRERTEKDIDVLDVKNYEYVPDGKYKIADGTVSVYDMRGNAVAVTADADGSKISMEKSGFKLIKVVDGQGKAEFVKLVAAHFISSAAEFISQVPADLDGYYVLDSDIVFGEDCVKIGAAPIVKNSDGYVFDKNGYASYDASEAGVGDVGGKPFTGTLDGNGYVMSGYTLGLPAGVRPYDDEAYYYGLFGYIGETGVVKNLTLRAASVTCGRLGGFIAGVNLGTVENIVIEEDCLLRVQYADGGYIAGYNGGTVKNVLGYAESFEKYDADKEEWVKIELKKAAYASGTGAVTAAAYVGDSCKSDMSEQLGDGWFYADGIGTVYGNAGYKKVVSVPAEMYEGADSEFTVYQRTADELVFVQIADGKDAYLFQFVSVSGAELQTYTFKLNVTDDLAPGDAFFVRIGYGDPLGYIGASNRIVVGEPYITSAKYEGAAITPTVGADIQLSSIDLAVTYSDGTSGTVKPLKYEGYNRAGAAGVAQSVKFYYGAGADDFVTIDVTPKTATGDVITALSVTAKDPTQRITYSSSSEIDFDSYFTFTATYSASGNKTVTAADAKMTVSSYKAGRNEVTFTYSDGEIVSSDPVEMDIWYEIATLDDWDSMNENLAGYYVLKNDLGFNNAPHKIGAVVTTVIGDSTQIDEAGAEDTAFTGKFDGGAHTLSGWATPYESGWNAEYFAFSMFAFIGSSGEVGNFVLDSFNANGCNYTAFVSSYNKGRIYDVEIKSTCSIRNNWDAAAAYAAINRGTVEGCTCAVTTFENIKDAIDMALPPVKDGNEPVAAVKND